MMAFVIMIMIALIIGVIVIVPFLIKSSMVLVIKVMLKLEHRRSQRRFDKMRPPK